MATIIEALLGGDEIDLAACFACTERPREVRPEFPELDEILKRLARNDPTLLEVGTWGSRGLRNRRGR